ncbi:PqqD family peptide modification chaperone [Brachybacterium saurashtrense]|uniref:PqqD family peptide modification chaperone n=1 Tax=Brachybacterium saurashtrense TaxID=556288 RepID=A0A345YSH4_9MICO|nr:PqqD family peptide modification chaperone [Brachybacterium saurashtrense]AXK46876.1 PqqD family peptide modification chaperone [Brachybacterium saurashtrense]RRR22591.1 PqqD family peptide modification chaperone [Brachybacterium saurashtrense]
MTRYRLGEVVAERDGEGLWVGALPDGPIGRLDGVGVLVLEVLADGEPHRVDQIVEELRRDVMGMPADAEAVIAEFLRDLAARGVVAAEPTDGGGR